MRYGADLKTPSASIQGSKVMIIDETAGSGGDLLPWMFRKFKLGTLVGKRTWGGLCFQPVFAHCAFGDFNNVFDVEMIHFIPTVLAHGFSVAQNFARRNSDTLLTLAEHSAFPSHCFLLRCLFYTL